MNYVINVLANLLGKNSELVCNGQFPGIAWQPPKFGCVAAKRTGIAKPAKNPAEIQPILSM
jgi:hypothetical protein